MPLHRVNEVQHVLVKNDLPGESYDVNAHTLGSVS